MWSPVSQPRSPSASPRASNARSSSAEATSSVGPSCHSAAWTVAVPTTWGCSAPSLTAWRCRTSSSSAGSPPACSPRSPWGRSRSPTSRCAPCATSRRAVWSSSAGVGMPYFSTDTVAVQRALEIGCEEVLMAKHGVDGVYDADPRTNPEATKLDRITYNEALQRGLKVVDSTAFSLCMDNAQKMMVFGLDTPDNITRAMRGERIGTDVIAD